MLLRFNKLYYPPDAGAPAGPVSQDKDDVIEFLGEDTPEEKEVIKLEDKTPPDKDKDKDKPTKEDKGKEIPDGEEEETPDGEDEEIDELTEIEEELEPPSEDQLELVTPVRRREILKKYPALFKDFPYLEKAYYREQQFTELLPTIDDAKEAVEAKQTLDKFENDLIAGNTEQMLKVTKEQNPKAFNKLVDNYMSTLAKVDPNAYHHVVGNTIKHAIMGMVAEGRASKNVKLEEAAQILNQWAFASSDFKPPTNLAKDDDKEDVKDKEIKDKEQKFIQKQFDNARDDLDSRINNSLRNTIDAYIDPKKSMTDFVRRHASREALETVRNLIEKDSRFKSITDKLWDKAFKTEFSKASLDAIKSAYHSKAKTLLPSVIKKARNEALKGMGKRVKEDDGEEQTPNKGPVRKEGQPQSQNKGGKITKAADIPSGMSTLDFLNSD